MNNQASVPATPVVKSETREGLDDVSANEEEITEARVCVDYDNPQSRIVLDILKSNGFVVVSSAVSGLGEPIVTVKGVSYHGLQQVRRLAEGRTVRR
jgi:hypothetical protein